MADVVKLNLVLEMRLKCITCGHAEDLRVTPFDDPDDFLRCPNWDGPVEMVERDEQVSNRLQRRNSRKGGVLIRIQHTNNG
jgi:hypothetical protein